MAERTLDVSGGSAVLAVAGLVLPMVGAGTLPFGLLLSAIGGLLLVLAVRSAERHGRALMERGGRRRDGSGGDGDAGGGSGGFPGGGGFAGGGGSFGGGGASGGWSDGDGGGGGD